MVFIYQVMLFFVGTVACTQQAAVDEIEHLRSLQSYASCDMQEAIERTIENIKKRDGVEQPASENNWIKKIFLFFSVRTLQLIFIGVMWLLIFFSWFSLLPYYRYALWAVMGYVLIGMLVRYSYIQSRIIIAVPEAVVYAGPSENFAQLYSLRYLHEAIYTKRLHSWYCISSENGSGWIAANACREIR